ncbi:MAG: hypothetical protein DRJ45_01050 [Thermoprotei archaeon]|nr:MAG: hypothetical protein DRJ45_01050 [Thermoprotei archaeon]
MSLTSIIIKKEFMEAIRGKNLGASLSSVLLFLGTFLFTSKERLLYIFMPYTPLIIGLMIGFSLSNNIVREKREGVIETILCSPMKLKELWLGKTLSISIISTIITILSTYAILSLDNYRLNFITIFYILITIPLFILASIGLLSLIYFYLGMRQIQIVNYILFMGIFLILFTVFKINVISEVTWRIISIITLFSTVTFIATFLMINYVDVEKLILTID